MSQAYLVATTLKQRFLGKAFFEKIHEVLVDLDDVKPATRLHFTQDFGGNGAGSGTNFEDPCRSRTFAKLRDQGPRQRSAAGQYRARREILPAKLPVKFAALCPVAHRDFSALQWPAQCCAGSIAFFPERAT